MSAGLRLRLAVTVLTAAALVLFGVIVWANRSPNRDPYLSGRVWSGLLVGGALGLLWTVATIPADRAGVALHIGGYTVFALATGGTARGLGRLRLLLPVVTGRVEAGPADGGAQVTAPFSGRDVLACAWRVEREVDERRELFETVATGTTGTVRVAGRAVTLEDRVLLGASEPTVPAREWPTGAAEAVGLAATAASSRRAVERRIEAGTTLTRLPNALYVGGPERVRAALRRVVVRVMIGGGVAVGAGAGVLATGCPVVP
jgi:hypothetical protein